MDSTCTECPAGWFQAASAAASCDSCPLGTYSSQTAANSSAVCRACAFGTVCRGDRTGCSAICSAGTVIAHTSVDVVAALAATCTQPTATQRELLCKPCVGTAGGVCVAGLTSRLYLMSAIVAADASLAPVEQPAANGTTGFDSSDSTATDATAASVPLQQGRHDSCGKMVVSTLFTEPAAAYQRVRTPLLALTGALCGAVVVALLCGLWSHHAAGVRAFLTRNDGFAADHPPRDDKILREAPTASGGLFSLVFRVAALGLALSLLAQLLLHTYIVVVSVIDTPPVDSGQATAAIHHGSHTARLLLFGGTGSNSTCPPVSVDSNQAWRTQSVEPVMLTADSPVPGFLLPPSIQESGLTACLLTAVCRNCRATLSATLTFTFPWSYQSVALSLAGRNAYPGCSPPFQRMFSAPSADRLMSNITMDVDVRPVALAYAGSLSPSMPREASGHDFVYASAAVQYKRDPSLLRPDIDTVALVVNLQPTPYCSQVTVTDAVDVLTLLSGLAGLVSGLGGAFRAVSRKWDRLGKPTVKVLKGRVPLSASKRVVLRGNSAGLREKAHAHAEERIESRSPDTVNPLITTVTELPVRAQAPQAPRVTARHLAAAGIDHWQSSGGRADFAATALDPVQPESYASRAIGGDDADREAPTQSVVRRQSTRQPIQTV